MLTEQIYTYKCTEIFLVIQILKRIRPIMHEMNEDEAINIID